MSVLGLADSAWGQLGIHKEKSINKLEAVLFYVISHIKPHLTKFYNLFVYFSLVKIRLLYFFYITDYIKF